MGAVESESPAQEGQRLAQLLHRRPENSGQLWHPSENGVRGWVFESFKGQQRQNLGSHPVENRDLQEREKLGGRNPKGDSRILSENPEDAQLVKHRAVWRS